MWKFILLLILANNGINEPVANKNEKMLGNWTGNIVQKNGAYKANYKYELFLTEKDGEIVGRSFIYADSMYAEMSIKGVMVTEKLLQVKEVDYITYEIADENMDWCKKNVQVLIKKRPDGLYLEGIFNAHSEFGNCDPGKVKLKKDPLRA